MPLFELIPPEFRGRGLSSQELARAQEEAEADFPPDLAELLTECLPTGGRFPDWRNEPAEMMARWRERVVEGMVFDVASGVWAAAWGERPANEHEACEAAAELVRASPDLVPVYGHRAIPNEPLEAGNPVFSVVQTDVVVYGSDLEDYLRREFDRQQGGLATSGRTIRFWTALTRA